MSQDSDPYHSTHPVEVIVPIRIQDGKLIPFYGENMPVFEDTRYAELHLPASAFQNDHEKDLYSYQKSVCLLNKGAELWAAFSVNRGNNQAGDGFPIDNAFDQIPPLPKSVWVSFTLQEDLYLLMRGTKTPQLAPCQCTTIPNKVLEIPLEAPSLNSLLTKISEKVETGRLSHSGNVFTQIFYQSTPDERFVSLDSFRSHEYAKFEQNLLQQIDKASKPAHGE